MGMNQKMTEKTLSDKITLFSVGPQGTLLELFKPENVKDFIKKVETIVLQKTITDEEKVMVIRKRAGDDLI